jgi:hypothetical protein
MTSYLFANHARIFDYRRFADPFRNQLRENAELLAAANGIAMAQGPHLVFGVGAALAAAGTSENRARSNLHRAAHPGDEQCAPSSWRQQCLDHAGAQPDREEGRSIVTSD